MILELDSTMEVSAYTHDLTYNLFTSGLLNRVWQTLAHEYGLSLVEKQVFYLYFGIGTNLDETRHCLGLSLIDTELTLSALSLKFEVTDLSQLQARLGEILWERRHFNWRMRNLLD